MANHGTDPTTRMALLAERLRAMEEIWNHDEASFHGEFVDFDRIWAWPKPVQLPRPPILVGGMGPKALDRCWSWVTAGCRCGCRWPSWTPWASGSTSLRTRAADAGKPRPTVTMFGGAPWADAVARYAELGIDTVLFELPDVDPGEVPKHLDEFAGLAAAGD